MRPMKATISRILLLSAAVLAGASGGTRAQPLPGPTDIPSSILLSHQTDISHLTELTHRPGALGEVAKKALDLLKRHHQREVEYILPPLTLIPSLAAGRFSPDMKWAVAMADKVVANREDIFREHTEITDVMSALHVEAEKVDDTDAADFARDALADSVGDMELQEPASVLVGEIVRAKLAATK
jgi:hypothetical protein